MEMGNGATIADESDKWAAAAVIPDSSMEGDTTKPPTPQPAKFHGHTNPSVSDHTHNFHSHYLLLCLRQIKHFSEYIRE